jgi:DNA-binding NarL/FixJ family response regulator
MEELSRTDEPDQFRDSQVETLTQRELEVLRELAKGMTNREIAERLYISKNTVKYHVHSILEKLDLPNRGEAAKFAKKHGLTD